MDALLAEMSSDGARDPLGNLYLARDIRDIAQAKLALVQCVAGQAATVYMEGAKRVGR